MSDALDKAARRTLKFATLRIYLHPENHNTMRYSYEPGHLFDLCRAQLRIRDDKLPEPERRRMLGRMQQAVITHGLATEAEVSALNQAILGGAP